MAATPTVLVGREDERGILVEVLGAVESLPVAVLLEGEAGIGKTALWQEGIQIAAERSYRVLSCRPAPGEAELTFAALGDLLAAVQDEALAALPEPQRRALAVALLLEEPGDTPSGARAIAAAFLGALRALAEAGPLVVAVDDVQWLDGPTALALEFALRRLGDDPIGLLLALRGPGLPPLPLGLDRAPANVRVHRIEVGPLSLGALHRLLRTRLGLTLARPTLRRVQEASGGNPLYALEIGRALQRQGSRPEPGRPLSVPATLRELVRERLEAQPPPVQEALAVVAALAQPTLRLVAADEAIDAAVSAGLLELEGERVRFTHPLLAEAAYALAGVGERREIHRRLALVVPDQEEQARHRALGAVGPSEEVAAVLDVAANRAGSRGAPEVAAELSELAAGLTPAGQVDDVVRRRLAAADSYATAGDPEHAYQAYEALLGELGAGPLRARALLGVATNRESEPEVTIALCRRALVEPGAAAAVRSGAHRLLGLLALSLGDVDAARAEARLAVADAGDGPDLAALAAALADVGLYDTLAGERPGPEFWRRALEVEEAAGDAPLYNGPSVAFGLALMYAERLDEARSSLERAQRHATRSGDEPALHGVLIHLTELECRAGRLAKAEEHANRCHELVGQVGLEQSGGAALYAGALVAAHRGLVEEARSTVREGIELADSVGDTIFRIQNLAVLGFLELSLGDGAAAAGILSPLWDALAGMGYGEPSVYPVLPNAVEALIAVGELEQARTSLDRLEERGRALDSPWALSAAARGEGLLLAAEGEPDRASVAFERALAEHARMPGPFERGRTLLALGVTQRRVKKRRAARESLAAALEIFERLGTALWAERARAELVRIGGRSPAGSRELTETERRVAALVAEGRTNREVAAALFVTVRTVEWNLSKIYRKLGVRSRSELAHVFRLGA